MGLSRARLAALRELQTARGRREQGCFLIDGEKLVRDALVAGAPCVELLARDVSPWREEALAAAVDVVEISAADAERLSETRTPQGVFAVIEDRLPDAAAAIAALPRDVPHEGGAAVVALDAVQDPGNVGAIIRSAAAFGCALALLGPGCADATHPRVTRAATGAWFQLPIARSSDFAADLASLRGCGARIIACSPAGGGQRQDELVDAPPAAATVYLFGNEGAGVSDQLAPLIDATISIPINPKVESLNVAVAAGVILSRLQLPEARQCELPPGT